MLSEPSQTFPTVREPIAVGIGTFDSNANPDALMLGVGGDLTLAKRGPADSWQTIDRIELGHGPQQTVTVERLNSDPLSDLVLMNTNEITVLHTSIDSGFDVVQTLPAPSAGGFASSARNSLLVDFVDADPSRDLVAVASTDGSVLVYPGLAGGTFAAPTTYRTGVDSPTTAIVADLIGDPMPDLVVGHDDGSIVFFEGMIGRSTFSRRDDLMVSESSNIVALGKGDFDDDGNTDLSVTTEFGSFILFSRADPRSVSPIVNGDFSFGLVGWETEVTGHTADATPGRVDVLGGLAELRENESFLTAVKQTILIPDEAEAISFELVTLGLDPVSVAGVPDAFEVSLLDIDQNSLVATHAPNSTAFYNMSSGLPPSLASGVTVDETLITLDVSSLPAGTEATLIFDLIGNPPGSNSVAAIDNVSITPDVVLSDTLDRIDLPAVLAGAVDASVGDVDGDGKLDLVVLDSANNSLAVLNGNGNRNFTFETIPLSAFGSVAASIAVDSLTSGDTVDDIIVTFADSDLAVSPIGADVTSPMVTLLDPPVGQNVESFSGTATFRFNEPMREIGVGAATNAEAYRWVGSGSDRTFGTSDDVSISINAVGYNALDWTSTVEIDATSLPLADDRYRLILAGSDPANAIRDTTGNPIGGGSDIEFDFFVDAALSLDAVGSLTGTEGEKISVSTRFADPGRVGNYQATIDWGDGSEEAMLVTLGDRGFGGTLFAEHIYADNSKYDVSITLADGDGEKVSVVSVVDVANAIPSLSGLSDIAAQENTLAIFDAIAFVTDTGFSFGSGEETFTATIDWGDGSPITEFDDITAVTASPSGPTTASIDASHTYRTEGVFDVKITVTDDDGGTIFGSLRAFVSNTPPVLDPLPAINAREGDVISFFGTYSDDDLRQGIDPSDLHMVTIDWGDGTVTSPTPSATLAGDASFESTHAYGDDGDYTITVKVADNANGVAMQLIPASITGAAPTAIPASDATTVAGLPTIFALASFTDPGFTNDTAGTEETFLISIDWGDGSSEETITEFSVSNGSPGVLTSGLISAEHTYTNTGFYTALAKIEDDDGLSATTSISIFVEDPAANTGACLPEINFDEDLTGSEIVPGTIITDQWALWGIHVTTDAPSNHPAMIFDSSSPTGGDKDLGTPHEDFRGPGVGSGGASGAAGKNSESLGNILIISEDGDATDPDDNASGGTFIFTFDNPVQLDEIGLIDLDSHEVSTITLFDVAGDVISKTTASGLGNNATQNILLDANAVARMEVELAGSGAITGLVFCRDLQPLSLSGPDTVTEGSDYRALLQTTGIALSSWHVSIRDRNGDLASSTEITPPKPFILSATFPDGDDAFVISGWATDGKGVYPVDDLKVDVLNVNPTLTISGEANVDAQTEYRLQLASVDPGDDTLLQWNIDWGDGNIEFISGNPESVTHVYAKAGDYTIIASAIDEDNASAGGASAPIVFEAEDFHFAASGSGNASGSSWVHMTAAAASGEEYLAASPNKGVNTGDSTRGPRLDYTAMFPRAGTYYVWVRMLGRDGTDDSLHFGINGQPATYGRRGLTDRSGSWHWEHKVSGRSGPDRVKIDVPSAGPHTLNLWMREDGTAVDKIVITDDASYVPSGVGPEVVLAAEAYLSNAIDISVQPGASIWLPNVDFSVDASGARLSAGERITDQYASIGFAVSTNNPSKPAMIFNSSQPSGGDFDLGTPNNRFGGPGRGAGGRSNDIEHGNLLIITEDNDADDPDDNAAGGVLIFDFDRSVMIDEIGLLDIQSGDNRIDLYDADGKILSSYAIPNSGNNGYSRVVLDSLHVRRMEVHLSGSGAITDIEFCRQGAQIPKASTRFFVSDAKTKEIFRYDTLGESLGEIAGSAAYNPRGITTTGEANPVWLISDEGSRERVYAYDTHTDALVGSWIARGLKRPEGIATDGSDIWIVDDGNDKVKRYSRAASRSSGKQFPADGFQLAFGNQDPRGITTDGETLWTVDGASRKVFAYRIDGTFLNWWNLDPENDAPVGITINPAGGDGVWVVDSNDNAVYHYANATLPFQGDQLSIGKFALADANASPTGIADPAFFIDVGETVTGSLIDIAQVDEYEFTKGFGPLFLQVESVTGGDLRLNYDTPFGGTATGIFSPGEVTELSYFDPGTFNFSVSVGSGTPSYSVSLLEVPEPSFGAINQGDTVVDSLDSAYATDIWTFNGIAGQNIFIDVTAGNSDLFLEIFDTAGDGGLNATPLASGPFADTSTIQLPSTGSYDIVVYSLSGAVATYGFTLNGSDLPSISPGTPVVGEIASAGEADAYTLAGLAGQTLTFDVVAADQFTFSFVAPSGETIFSELMVDGLGNGRDQNEILLPETGDYVITIDSDGGEGFSTGPYEFVVTEPIIDTTLIRTGDSVSSGIAVAGEIDRYVFSVAPDQAIQFDFTNLSGGSLQSLITDADGNVVSSRQSLDPSDHDFGPQITVPGTYTLQLTADSGNFPSYAFGLDEAPYSPTVLTNEDSITEQIENAAELDAYTFEASPGDRINIDFASVTTTMVSELVAPDGSVIRSTTSDLAFPHSIFDSEVDGGGTYTLRLYGFGGETPTYGFDFNRAILNPPTSINLGDAVDDTVDVRREINQYNFEATAGDAFFVNFNELSGGTIRTSVVGPNDELLADANSNDPDTHDSGRFVATVDGTYTIQVGGVDEDLAGYSFRLDEANEDNLSIEIGSIHFGEIETPGSLDTYDFHAAQGESLFIDFLWLQEPIDADFSRLKATLLDPNGDSVFESRNSTENQLDGFATDLPETGQYRLVVSGDGDDRMRYEFRINSITPSQPIPLAIGDIVSDSVDFGGQQRVYSFATTAGTELTLDVLLNEAYLFVPSVDFSIVSPSGSIAIDDVNSDTTFVASETGRYEIVIDNRNASPLDLTGDFAFRLLGDSIAIEPEPADLVVSDVTVDSIAVGNPGQIQVSWTVTNVGTANATGWDASKWVDRIIFSNDDDSPDVPQRVLAEVPFDGELSPGATYTQSTAITLPQNLEGGFWVFVETDASNRVYEGEASKNNVSRAETLTAVFPAVRPVSNGPAIEIAPEDGSYYAAGTDLTLSGNVRSGGQSVNAIFVIDVSRSTSEVTGLDVNGDGIVDAADDLNDDGKIGDILDAEIGAAIRLTDQLETRSDDLRVATVLFAGSSTLMDGGPERFNQFFVDPELDTTYDGNLPNLDLALRNLVPDATNAFRHDFVTGGTSFTPPISNVRQLLAAAQPADRTLVYFLTDGEAFDPDPIPLTGVADQGIEFFAFQLGGASVTPELDALATAIDADATSSGTAIAVSSIEQLSNQLISTIDVESVTVNGVPVSAIDAAGNFFAPVNISAGPNLFNVVASTAAGTSSETSITLFGGEIGPVTDFSSFKPAPVGLQATFAGTTFNRSTNQLHTSLAVQNNSTDPVAPPLIATIEEIRPISVTVENGEGTTPGGESFYVFDREIGPAWPIGATSNTTAVSLSNPTRSRFALDVQFRTTGNSPPFFTGLPTLLAEVGQTYSYSLESDDNEGDAIAIRLLEGPSELKLEANVLNWTPTAFDVGHHSVAIETSDGRGGFATQRFTLLVQSGQTNNPPLVLSTPQRFATVDDEFVYDILAVDPEGGPVELSIEEPSPTGIELVGTRLTWTPQAGHLGSTTITVRGSDSAGAVGRQTFELSVRGANAAPTFSSTPPTSAIAGEQYFYAAIAEDTEDAVAYSIEGPTGIVVDAQTGRVVWPSSLVAPGTYPITVTATDERGLATEQAFTLIVASDEQPPTVDIASTTNLLELGETARVTVFARDNVQISSTTLTVDGVVVPIDADSGFDYAPETAGIKEIVFTAIDSAGNASSVSLNPFIRVLDPNDATPPQIELSSPSPGEIVTYLTDIVGSVTDENLEFYEAQVALAGTDDYRTIAQETFRPGPGGNGVVDDLLGVFDPTLLANDTYDLRILAQDVSGNVATLVTPISIEGQAKLGNFRISLTDLGIPVAGIPITINRVYDTLESQQSYDFGYGWRLDIGNPRIRESVPVSDAEESGAGMFGANAFLPGTRVYLNSPKGRRVGFTFDPVPEPQLLGTLWRPRFVADPGVYDRLEVADLPLQQNSDGTFGLYLTGFPYNPSEYTLVTRDQLRFNYDQFSEIQLQSITDRNDVSLTYDENGIHSSIGPSIIWTRDSRGRITQILDTAGNPFTYTYTTDGDLESFTDQIGNVTRMSYRDDPGHYLQSITDPRGIQILSLAYDEDGRLTAEGDAFGNANTQSYDLAANTQRNADRNGNEYTFVYDDRGNILQETDPRGFVTAFQYDADDNEIAITNKRGFTTRYEYDAFGNLVGMTDPLGGTVSMTFNARNDVVSVTDELGRTTEFRYDDAGNPIETIDPQGQSTRSTFDSEGRVLSQTDKRGNVTTFRYDIGCGCPRLPGETTFPDGTTMTVETDALGVPIRIVDQRGFEQTFRPDASGRVLSSTNQDGETMTYAYDGNLLVREIDPIGRSTTYEYDERRLLAAVTNPAGDVYRVERDANGDITTEIDQLGRRTETRYDEKRRVIESLDALGFRTEFVYDEQDNLIGQTDARNNTIRFEYDALDRLTRTTDTRGGVRQFEYNAVDNLIRQIDELGFASVFEYDDLERLTKATNAIGESTEFTYDANDNLIRQIDSLARADAISYDAMDRMVSRTDADGFSFAYNYDSAGNVLSVIDPSGASLQFERDPLGRVVAETDQLGRLTTAVYDDAGRLAETTDRNGRTKTFGYDILDRMVAETWYSDDGAVANQISATYDAVGNRLTLTDNFASHSWLYDERNFPIRSSDLDSEFGLTHSLSYSYDAVGNLIDVTDDLGISVALAYDSENALNEMIWKGPAITGASITLERNLRNEVTSISRFSDAIGLAGAGSTRYEYDAVGRTTSIDHFDANDQVLLDYDFAYDLAGQLIEEVLDGVPRDYAYDARGQLIDVASADVALTESFAFDSRGNRDAVENEFDAANQLLSDTSFDYEYDHEGNRTRKTNRETGEVERYAYDHDNRLVQYERSDSEGNSLVVATYRYDATGRRISKTVVRPNAATETTRFLYFGSDAWAATDELGNLKARYLPGLTIDQLIARETDSGLAFYLRGHDGSVEAIIDASTVIVNQNVYNAFGVIIGQSNASEADRFAFTGREFDSESGLYHYRARSYDPAAGIFTSRDPIGLGAGDTNFYRYVSNAPTHFADPSGMVSVSYSGFSWNGVVLGAHIGLLECVIWTHASQVIPGLNGQELAPIGAGEYSRCIVDAAVGAAIGGAVGGLRFRRGGSVRPTIKIAPGSRGQHLRNKYGHLTPSQRRTRIKQLKAANNARRNKAPRPNPAAAASNKVNPWTTAANTKFVNGRRYVLRDGGSGVRRWHRTGLSSNGNTTSQGVPRTNATDWRQWRNTWDQTGIDDILSPTNRRRIAAGETPRVDENWIRYFPGDADLIDELVPMHHIQGSPLTVPLPATRHLDAHMPGGFRFNPGGPGSTG